MDEAFVVRGRIALSCKGAHVLVHAAEKRAAALDAAACIAVVDASGELLAFSRMDGMSPAGIEDAVENARLALKAWSLSGQAAGAGADAGGSFAGIAVVVDGQPIAALGVSSRVPESDAPIARAGVDAFLSG
jgi:glc operon protein GlcG